MTEPANTAPKEPSRFSVGAVRETPVAFLFVLVNAIVFAVAEWFGDTTTIATLIQFGASGRSVVWAGEPWRLLTSVFLHIGWIHFLWNSYGILGWCREVERTLDSPRFAAIYLLTGIGASAGSVIGHNVISAGASGAGFGVIGTLLFLRAREQGGVRALLKDPKARGWLQGIAVWFVIGSFVGMDNVAHGTGLALGVLAGFGFTSASKPLRAAPMAATVVLVLLSLRPIPGIHRAPGDFEKAMTHWQNEEWPAVLASLESVLARDDAPVEAFEAAAIAHYMLGHWAESKAAGDRVMQVQPQNGRVLAFRCGAYISLHDFESARRACDRAISFGSNDEWTRSLRFSALVVLGDLATGEADADRLTRKSATLSEGLGQRARFRWLRGNHAGAEADYRALLEREESALARAGLAQLLSSMGRNDEAVAELVKVSALEPTSYLAPHVRCMLASTRGEYEDARSECDEAARRAPDNMSVRDTRAWVHYRLGRPDAALAEIRAIQDAGGYTGWTTRALIRAERGDHEGALSDSAAELKGERRSAGAWLARARVALAKRDVDRAREALVRAKRDLDPRDDLAPDVEAELAKLPPP